MEWLESERCRHWDLARSLGIPATIPLREHVAATFTETSATYEQRERQVNPLAAPLSRAWAEIRSVEAKRGASPAVPAVLHEHYGNRCDMWVAGLVTPKEGTPGERAAQIASWLTWQIARDYISSVPALDTANAERAESLVDGLLELVERDDVLFVTAVPVAGLRLSAPSMDHEGVVIRPLTSEEITGLEAGSIGDYDRPAPLLAGQSVLVSVTTFRFERCLLAIKAACPKTKQPGSRRASAVVLAFQLLGFDLRGRGDAVTYTEPGPPLWGGGTTLRLADSGAGVRDFGAPDLKAVVELSDLIPKSVLDGPFTRPGIALHRFGSATCESSPGDAIIDFVTALEALLLSGQAELSFRLALYGSRYLTTDPTERRQVFDQLKSLYNLRSGLVHGQVADAGRIREHRTIARDLTGRLLVKALREGWPTPRQLEDLALS